jgi:hypothetical protein
MADHVSPPETKPTKEIASRQTGLDVTPSDCHPIIHATLWISERIHHTRSVWEIGDDGWLATCPTCSSAICRGSAHGQERSGTCEARRPRDGGLPFRVPGFGPSGRYAHRQYPLPTNPARGRRGHCRRISQPPRIQQPIKAAHGELPPTSPRDHFPSIPPSPPAVMVVIHPIHSGSLLSSAGRWCWPCSSVFAPVPRI